MKTGERKFQCPDYCGNDMKQTVGTVAHNINGLNFITSLIMNVLYAKLLDTI